MTIEIKPAGFPCKIEECPPGMFLYENQICFKSEYKTNAGEMELYCDSGEAFVPREVLVTPLEYVVIE